VPAIGGTHSELDGTKWGSLTLDDMVASVASGYTANGNKNGFTPDQNSGDPEFAFDLGVQTPGFVQLPLCLEVDLDCGFPGAPDNCIPELSQDAPFFPCSATQ
jgi:hypothetical protein